MSLPEGILNDEEIRELCVVPARETTHRSPMITPFVERCEEGVISYGVSSYGYDIRAGYEWKLFTNMQTAIVDPKKPSEKSFVNCMPLHGDTVIIPPNSYALTSSVEEFHMPPDVMAICLGKSTYARVGISINCTPLEPGWKGYLTIEVANCTPCPVMVYPGEGIAQLIFFRGRQPKTTYASRKGKYQNQPNHPVVARMNSTLKKDPT